MYVSDVDEGSATLLGIYAGHKEPEDLDEFALSMARNDALAVSQGRGGLFVIAPDPGYPPPSSTDRQRIAEVRDALRASSSLILLVTASPMVRGAITAVSWISRNRRCHTVAAASLAEALVLAERYRPPSALALRQMYTRLRRRIADVESAAAPPFFTRSGS
jgi:hypothetical protein